MIHSYRNISCVLRYFAKPVLYSLNLGKPRHTLCTKSLPYSLTQLHKEFLLYPGGSVDLKLNEDTGIAELCLSHLEKKNALTGSMMVQLADVVCQLEQWQTGKGVILHTPGKIFCSGGDLDMARKICTPEHGLKMATLMHDTLHRFLSLPLISVVIVQGNAIGGGAEIVTAADFRLATSECSFQFVQKRLGIAPGWGGGTRLVRLLGPSRALELLTTCRRVSAEEALEMGLVSAILKPELCSLSQAHDWLSSMTKGPPHVVRTVKNIVVAAASKSVKDALYEERQLFATLWGGKEHEKHIANSKK